MDTPWVRKAPYVLAGLVIGIALVAISVSVLQSYSVPDQQAPVAEEVARTEITIDPAVDDQSSGVAHQDSSNVQLDFESLLYQSHFSRATAVHSHLSNADVDHVASFLEQTESIVPSSLRREAQEAAIRRLAQLDPQKALSEAANAVSSVRNSLTSVVFQEWSVEDLDEAIDQASGLQEEDRRFALEGILLSRTDLSGSLLNDVIRRLGGEQTLADRQSLSLAGEAIDDPHKAWSEFLAVHGGDVETLSSAQRVLLNHILDSWVDRGDSGELANAVNLSLDSDGHTDSAIQLLLETWVESDPSIALSATLGIDNEETRRRMQEAIVSPWVKLNPQAVLDGMALIPDELQDWSKKEALVAVSVSTPSEAVKRLSIISDSDTKSLAARDIATNWAKLDPEAARDWVHSDPELKDLQWGLMYRVVMEVSKVNPEKAFEWALEEPVLERRQGEGLEQWVINFLASQGKFGDAIRLAARARDIHNREGSYVWIGNELIRRGKSGEAWELLEKLPERLQGVYATQVAANWVRAEPDTAMERFASLPSQELKETLAHSLYTENQMHHWFTKEQLRSLKEYLPPWFQREFE